MKSCPTWSNGSSHSVSATTSLSCDITQITELLNNFKFISVNCYASWKRIDRSSGSWAGLANEILTFSYIRLNARMLLMYPTLATHTEDWIGTNAFHTYTTWEFVRCNLRFWDMCLKPKALVFLMFTLRPFSSSPSFEFFNLTFSSPSDSATMTRSSAYSSSLGQPVLNSRDRASITITESFSQHRSLMYFYQNVNWVAIAVCDSDFQMSIVIHKLNNLNLNQFPHCSPKNSMRYTIKSFSRLTNAR